MSETVYLTEEGLEKLEKELHQLRTEERPNVAQEIAEARDKGDLSENAEYDAAKEKQGHIEARIAKLEDTLSKARVVDESAIDEDKVYILSDVKVKNHTNGNTDTYTLVAPEEADFKERKISVKSPIAQALLGHEVGDVVEANVPAGTLELEILEISRALPE
jgi:transcription elongation factor GreA